MADRKLGTRALTSELKKLAAEVIDIDDGAEPVTREQKLAQMIWNLALGWIENQRDDDGNLKKIRHPPVAWAMQFLFERCEGKAPQAVQEETTGIRAADKVRELSVERVNAITTKLKKKLETKNAT